MTDDSGAPARWTRPAGSTSSGAGARSGLLTADLDRLLTGAMCLAQPVLVAEVVVLDDELLVGIIAHGGRWFLPEDPRADDLGFVSMNSALGGPTQLSLPLPFPWPLSRRLALARLALWQERRRPLVAALSVADDVLGLADLHDGVALVGPL